MIDRTVLPLVAAVLATLVVATVVVRVLEGRTTDATGLRTLANVRVRVVAWWWMVGVLLAALAVGRVGVLVLFAGVSLRALRELLGLVPAAGVDRATLRAVQLAVPLQYAALWAGSDGMFVVLVPVGGLLAVSVGVATSGEPARFLQRIAAILYALLVAVYGLGHAPALLLLSIPGHEGQGWKLLVFLVTVVQASDVLQFLWGKALGRTPILPKLSPSKTVEGLLGGVASATVLGAVLSFLTPFSAVEAAVLAFVCTVAGFAGGAVMSGIKRDAGVKDYGALIPGHGGMLDRVDSLVFAAPVFFHLVRWWG